MTPDHLDLARRAVADPRWRWEPGMLLTEPGVGSGRVVYRGDSRLSVAWQAGSIWQPVPADWSAYLPDLTDAATVGVILSWLTEYEVGTDDSGYRASVPRKAGEIDWIESMWSPTLGEAAVRAWLALGEGR